jgi:hypothetical protein
MVTTTTYPKTVEKFEFGLIAKLTTARKTFVCKFSDKDINPGEQYYMLVEQYGVTTHPIRVRAENLDLYFRAIEIRRAAARC